MEKAFITSEKTVLGNGKVALLDVMGSDESIVNTARISYGKGTKKTSDTRTLIRYLIRHHHTSPLEFGEAVFYLKIPIFVMRQIIRHRTASVSEVSGRYSEIPNDFFLPPIESIREQSTINKQGRSEQQDYTKAIRIQGQFLDQMNAAFEVYEDALVSNVTREIARVGLPLATFTEVYWKMDLNNLFKMFKLRMDSHAQEETREVATGMYELLRPHFPLACEAAEDYILNTRTLSRLDQILLANTTANNSIPSLEFAQNIGMSRREYEEFVSWYNALSPTTA